MEDPGQNERPYELSLNDAIIKYGAPSVFGRVMTCSEINRIEYAVLIVNLYRQSRATNNIVTWTNDNPVGAALLFEAAKIAGATDNG